MRSGSWIVILLVLWPMYASAQRHTLSPPSQGYFMTTTGPSNVELHGLRVPVVIRTTVHEQILMLASYWADMMGATLRVVSAMDHIHTRKSAHYAGRAIDFQGDHLNELAIWFKSWGYTVYWQVPGHYRHVHVEAR